MSPNFKCARATYIKEWLTTTENIQINLDTTVEELEKEDIYKYLRVHEGGRIQHAKLKEKTRKEHHRRIRLGTNSEFNSTNQMKAIKTLPIPVVTYRFNIDAWKLEEIRRADGKRRRILASERMHHSRSEVERLYLPRNEGGMQGPNPTWKYL